MGARQIQHGIRTVPAGSLQFVDFSKPDDAADRMERFTLAAQHAMAEGEYDLAAQRLVYAREAQPRDVHVLRLLTIAFWQAGRLNEAGRAVRDWARVEEGPAPHRFAARIYEDMGAVDLAAQAAARSAEPARATPAPGSAWAVCASRSRTARERSKRFAAPSRWAPGSRPKRSPSRRWRSTRSR